MKSWLLIGAASLSIISGCSSTNNNTGTATAVGAVLGAVLGKATGDHDKSRYVWGAAVGAIAGNVVGRYMDQQERELQEKLANSGVQVTREGNEIHLYMPGNITFETGSAAIQSQFNVVLEDVAAVLNEYPKTILRIEGHTDDVGSAQYNQQLSESRALSVKHYLIGELVDARRITTVGMGEFEPIAANNNEENRQLNRRVELKIQPLT